jgi:hypothetical protein
MKQNFMKTENEYKNTKTEEQRYSQINSQLQMLRNNITKLDNNKEQFPDYNKKTNNVIQNNKIDTDSSNSSSVKKEETKKSTYSRKSRKKANDLTINI